MTNAPLLCNCGSSVFPWHRANCPVADGAPSPAQTSRVSPCDGAAASRSNSVALPRERRVVCAAIRAADGSVLLGIRHYSRDMHEQIAARNDGLRFLHRHDEDQGFVDQYGVYMSRAEAYAVAEEAGQVRHPEHCGDGLDGPKLYSEGLY